MKVTLLVRLKDEITDVNGRTILDGLNRGGFTDVSAVRTGKIFEVELNTADVEEARSRAMQIGKKVLSSETTEEFVVVDVSAS